MKRTSWLVLVVTAIVAACAPPERSALSETAETDPMDQPEALSLFGEPLYPMELSEETRARLEANLNEARARYEAEPDDPESIIWLGRRLAYLWRYREAIDVFSDGLARFPESYKLYRHRGHRFITVREFDNAIADLEKAANLVAGLPDEVEPDGAPNAAGVPRSTTQSNIWYHLGLAHYLKGDFERALDAYLECMKVSRVNDDMLVATADWLYMTYRRLGRETEAAEVLESIHEDMDILENFSYHKRLLMYQGLVEPDALLSPEQASDLDLATQGYGVGNWYLYNGDEERAMAIFEQVLEGSYWAAFGYIAAEADMKRMSDLEASEQ